LYIIAIEGPSRVGKATQSDKLFMALGTMGHKAAKLSFPQYGTPIGNLIYNMLHSDGPVDQFSLHYLYEADRAAAQSAMDSLQAEGYKFLIVDRYLFTGALYGYVCRQYPYSQSKALQTGLRKPDLNVVLDLSPEEALARANYRPGDIYEQKLQTQTALMEECRRLCQSAVKNVLVSGQGTAEEVHARIMAVIKERFHLG